MKYFKRIQPGDLYFDYDSYYESLKKIESKIDKKFLDEYIEREYFHDYCVRDIEICSFPKAKNCVLLTLSNGYKDSSEKITLKYTNVFRVEYLNECEYQDVYLYGEISLCDKNLKHEMLFDDGELTIIAEKISIVK